MTEAVPAGSLFDDEEFTSLVEEFERRKSPVASTDDAALLDLQVKRELRNLKARAEATRIYNDEQAAATDDERASPLIWPDFLSRDLTNVDWIAGKITTKGQQVSLVGDGKAGKSLLALEWAWRASAGLPFLGDEAREPIRVLYVDQENSHDDIQSRLVALGATAETLENLTYLSFPAFRALNTAGGGGDLMRSVEKHESELVFLDTISRMIEGKENDSDPWLDLYRYTLLPLKRAGGGSVRLDHFGKDKERGSRGSSAKNQDVDHVWELHAPDGDQPLKLKRTHTRTGIGPDFFDLHRLGENDGDRWAAGSTRHVLAAPAGTVESQAVGSEWVVVAATVKRMDELKVPTGWGRDRIRAAYPDLRVSNSILADAINHRRSGARLGDAA